MDRLKNGLARFTGFARAAPVAIAMEMVAVPVPLSATWVRFSSFIPIGVSMTPHRRDVRSTRIGILLAVAALVARMW